MNISNLEKIWLFLHDDKRVVGINDYVNNRYMYLSRLLEMLHTNPECITELKLRMLTERLNDSDTFLKIRDGYGKTEYRIVKLMSINKLGEILKNYFPDLVPEGPKSILKP